MSKVSWKDKLISRFLCPNCRGKWLQRHNGKGGNWGVTTIYKMHEFHKEVT